MLTARGSVTVVEHKNGGSHVEVYDARIDAVLGMLDLGSIGDGTHGSEAHVQALQRVVEKANTILAMLKDPPKRKCNKHDDCDAADAAAKTKGNKRPYHCTADDCEECFGS